MPTLKEIKESKIKISSKLLKTNEDYIPISPELIKELRYKTLFASSPMKLTYAQYDKMCNDDTVLDMMSIVLNKPKDKLKKFCKYLSVFKQNIHLSPKKLTAKITETDIQDKPIFKLPKEIRTVILEKFSEMLPTKYVLLDWIDKDKLDWDYLSYNPNAIELLKTNIKKINWKNLYENPNAIDLLKEKRKIDWIELSKNPNAIELLKNNPTKIHWMFLSKNPNAIDLLIEYSHKIDWISLSANPNAIKLLEENPTKINWDFLSSNPNPNAIDLLKKRIKYETNVEYNKLKYLDKINWNELSKNPNAIKLLKKYPTKINWTLLCLNTNPNAIKLLEENSTTIDWNFLSSNPNAIDLLEKKIEYENNLTSKEYNNLNYYEKINWNSLSLNPNVIKLLKKQIEYENSLDTEENNNLKKINWKLLSTNPNAIDLLQENKNKINWKYLSKNPSIFKVV